MSPTMVKLQHFQFMSSRSQIENSKIQTSLPSPYLLKTASVERSFHIVTFVFNSNMAHFVSQTQDDQSPFSSEEESPKKPRFLPSQEHLELCAIDPRKNAFFNNHFDTAISNCREQASLISVRSHQRKMPRSSSKGKKKNVINKVDRAMDVASFREILRIQRLDNDEFSQNRDTGQRRQKSKTSEEWNGFWSKAAKAERKKRRKPLTVVESKEKRKKKAMTKLHQRVNDFRKPFVHLLDDPDLYL